MICQKLFLNLQAFLLLLLFLSVLLVSLSAVSFASDSEDFETVQDEQLETPDLPLMDSDQQGAAADQLPLESEQGTEFVEDEQNTVDLVQEESNSYPIGIYDQFDSEYDVPTYYTPFIDTDSEILLTLKSIEYQLKIIAGGMVLAVISLFIWFTILKPIKQFSRF